MTESQIAQVIHEAVRGLQRVHDEVVNLPWENLSHEMRESTIDGVRRAMAGATPEEQHEGWCETRRLQGWVYGEVKDFAAKEHPCLVPYDELPPEQQVKDRLFLALVNVLSDLVAVG